MATGVPNQEVPSKKALKQKAIRKVIKTPPIETHQLFTLLITRTQEKKKPLGKLAIKADKKRSSKGLILII